MKISEEISEYWERTLKRIFFKKKRSCGRLCTGNKFPVQQAAIRQITGERNVI